MYRNLRTLALTLLLFAGLAVATTNARADTPASGDAGVLACLDSAKAYVKGAGHARYPVANTAYLTTTTACSDIQIKPIVAGRVKMCVDRSSGDKYCQPNFRYAAANVWTVIATNIADRTRFYFRFETTAYSLGHWAA